MAKKNEDTKAAADLVRVKYSSDPKRARAESITITGVGSFTRGGKEISAPISRTLFEQSLQHKGFDLVSDDEYKALTAAKAATPATEKTSEPEK